MTAPNVIHDPRFEVGPGTRLNGIYEVDALVAKGGMGEVYKAHILGTTDPVAIKMVRREFLSDDAFIALFKKEASALFQLQHEAIVRYYVSSTDPVIQRPYLAMEYIDGESLSEALRRAPLSYESMRILTQRLASALDTAHKLGIVHRDVTPDNIFLPGGSAARAKIIDFGIARSAFGGETVIAGNFAGKMNFVSPEQTGLFGGQVTAKSDIYSLGLSLVAAALGAPLDMGGTQVSMVRKRQAIPDISLVDARLQPILRRMLQPRPENRPESMAEVVAWCASAPADGGPVRSGRAPGRGLMIAGGLVLALAAAAAGTWTYVGLHDTKTAHETTAHLAPEEANHTAEASRTPPAATQDAVPESRPVAPPAPSGQPAKAGGDLPAVPKAPAVAAVEPTPPVNAPVETPIASAPVTPPDTASPQAPTPAQPQGGGTIPAPPASPPVVRPGQGLPAATSAENAASNLEPPRAAEPIEKTPGTAPPPSTPAASVPIAPMPALPAPTIAPQRTLDPNNLQDCPTCPRLVNIPAGSFRMGSNADPTERPVHRVAIKAFAIGRAPITVADWLECVRDAACAYKPAGDPESFVDDLSFQDATEYLNWLSRVSGHAYRLPSEAEWEYAGRGGTTTLYWWGDQFKPDMAPCRTCGQHLASAPRESQFKPNPFGLYGVTGGVAQWTADCWHKSYAKAPADGSAWVAPGCGERVLRGGSWMSDPAGLRISNRDFYDAGVRYPGHGIRVARDL